MIDAFEASLVVRAQACMARVEGMKAENEWHLKNGDNVRYGLAAFNEEAATLEHIAQGLRTRAGY